MDREEFEKNKKELKDQLEKELQFKAQTVLQQLITEIMADPRTVTASILGLDVGTILKKVINKNIKAYTKEE